MIDDHEVVKGIVSLSDILQALVLTNGDNGKTAQNTVRFKAHRTPLLSAPIISGMFIIDFKNVSLIECSWKC